MSPSVDPDPTTPSPDPGVRVWSRYVAIGDSFTEGMVDQDAALVDAHPEPAAEYAGWADRLARHLSARALAARVPFGYANLAVRGRKLDDVVGPQLDSALAMDPDLVSIVGGGNDLLRPSVDLDSLATRLEAAVVRIRATGADVLLATPTDTRDAGLFKPLRGRHGIHTANLFTIAQRHGCSVLNLWGMASIRDWRMWGDDRIHLNSLGHVRVADGAAVALGLAPLDPAWDEPLPPADRAARAEELRQHAEWVRVHAAPWVQRRMRGTSSGDALVAKRPNLTPYP